MNLQMQIFFTDSTFNTSITAQSSSNESAYDYIIVGGGTAGLALANRLSSCPDLSVLVIESGDTVFDNENVTDITRLAYTYDSPIDWAYETTEQTFGGRTQIMRAGKALGGTSVMNGAAYVRAEKSQVDAFESDLLNLGWNWDGLFPHYLKSESLRLPNKTQVEAGAPVIPAYHGFNGPVEVGFQDIQREEGDIGDVLNRTLKLMGVPWNRDLNSGAMRGFSLHPYTVGGDNIRSDAARAYYLPVEDRENLHLLLNTSVTKVVWSQEDEGNGHDLVAKGVQIEGEVINARREVILSAGAMRSPGLLELSGVGNPRFGSHYSCTYSEERIDKCSILRKHNIPVHLDLPSIGENLQDQLNTSFVVRTKTPITGTRTVAFISARDLFGPATDSVSESVLAKLPNYAAITAESSNGAMTQDTLLEHFESQHDLIFNKGAPIGEFVFILGGSHQLHVGYWGLLPFARGDVHISANDANAAPVLNPNYGLLDWDVDVQIEMSRFLRRMFSSDEMNGLVEEIVPGFELIPEDAPDEAWREWIADQYTPNFHAVGTASMLPADKGGVVDARFKVHGTKNVRIVDSSVIPVQLCGHPVANVYAIAEWAADMMKEAAETKVKRDLA
ncbi:hypothetical protein BDV19DRAFT_396247 [Aspergillus venezuelensis]